MFSDFLFNVAATLIGGAFVLFGSNARRPSSVVLGLGLAALGDLTAAALAQTNLFHLLRLLAFITFGHAPLLLAATGWSLRRMHRVGARISWAAAVLLLIVAVYASLIEPRWLAVRHVRIESAKLERALRIAVVSDLQTDRVGAHERRALTLALQARPDLILLPGDYIQEQGPGRALQVTALRELLGELRFGAPLGAYAVRGNVDPPGWPALFAGLDVTALERSTTVAIGEIELTGLDLWDSFDVSRQLAASERFQIAFGHAPDFALGTVRADLLVAGHTHGGQVRLPFWGPLITFSEVPRRWAAGVTALEGGRTLVVSRGVGMERGQAPRLRFLCRPEIVIIDVVPRPAT